MSCFTLFIKIYVFEVKTNSRFNGPPILTCLEETVPAWCSGPMILLNLYLSKLDQSIFNLRLIQLCQNITSLKWSFFYQLIFFILCFLPLKGLLCQILKTTCLRILVLFIVTILCQHFLFLFLSFAFSDNL